MAIKFLDNHRDLHFLYIGQQSQANQIILEEKENKSFEFVYLLHQAFIFVVITLSH